MIKRFRMVAGPNGSGKSTLAARLVGDYSVNFYTGLNADEVFAEVSRTRTFLPPFPIDGAALAEYAMRTDYATAEKARFANGEIVVEADCVCFAGEESVNSYTVALLVNFLQDECINRGISFSQETVFSHPSKVAALAKAASAGYRTYLYYVATDSPAVNSQRVAERYAQGGHSVPQEKITARYVRSLENLPLSVPYLWRAFFFDNSGLEMRYLASWSKGSGFEFFAPPCEQPAWFRRYALPAFDVR